MPAVPTERSNEAEDAANDREIKKLRSRVANLRLSLDHLPSSVDAIEELRVRVSVLVRELCERYASRDAAVARPVRFEMRSYSPVAHTLSSRRRLT